MNLLPSKLSKAFACILLFSLGSVANAQVIWEREQIDRVRTQYLAGDASFEPELTRLRRKADEALVLAPFSVTHKKIVPPSGDVHDYLSFSRYWWPDPDKPDGLPYIRKDGVVNRELISNGDRNRLGDLCDAVQSLALAGYVFNEPRYSRHAAKMVRAWFLDEATRMNPNLNFGQGVPGREHGRGPGIIDTRGFMLVLDSVELLDEQAWSVEDRQALQGWFDAYQQWLKESPLGQHEQRADNNHGSWYAAQGSRYALYAGKEDVAKAIVKDIQQRIAVQFDADGNQAAELKRTLSLHYCLFNLTALSRVACVGDKVGVDVWNFTPDHGCGLKKAYENLMPYMTSESEWPYVQLKEFSISPSSHLTLRLFSQQFGAEHYQKAVSTIPFRHQDQDLSRILVGLSGEAE